MPGPDLALYLDFAKTIAAAVISTGGVLWAVHLTNEKVARREREKRDEERSRDKVAMLVILAAHLEDFAFACRDIAGDGGFTDGDGRRQALHALPQFDPLKVEGIDWRVLPPEILTRVVGLPLMQKHYDRTIEHAGEDDFDDDQGATFFARREAYAGLGLEAARQAEWMRGQAGLPSPTLLGGVRPEQTVLGGLQWYVDHFAQRHADLEADRSSPPTPSAPSLQTASALRARDRLAGQ